MGEYGYKIKNIEAATLLEYQWGTRTHYEYKDALFVNSLFNDYLTENGLETNGESTRDLICLEFNYGTRSYEQEIEHLYKISAANNRALKAALAKKDKHLIKKYSAKKEKINDLVEAAYKNKDNYHPIPINKLREKMYQEGCDVTYTINDRLHRKFEKWTVHYKMLFRSTNKAKKGTVIFCAERLYDDAINFLRMGIQLPEHDVDIVGISAYSPLVASGIEGRVKINPRNILILEDVDRFFKTNVISIETDENRHCYAKRISDYDLMNELFDGQALIDTSIFPEWASGYVLLRHHFCKMAAFHANMQLFFQDWCRENGQDYETYTVNDMWGNPHRLKDVELLTTVNAVKWVKYGVTYDYWCRWVEANGCTFGVVKHSHPSKIHPYQKMSYQMANSLSEEIMESAAAESTAYVQKLKNDTDVFHNYLRKNSNFANDYDVLLALCEYNPDFIYSAYYKERKSNIIASYMLRLKSGEIIQYADNLTIVGSPYAMLLYGASGDESAVDADDTLLFEPGTIQCYTSKFEDGEYLAGFRSPFNGKYNMSYLHNHYDERMEKYFNFVPQIIAVNMIGTDFQSRNNGLV